VLVRTLCPLPTIQVNLGRLTLSQNSLLILRLALNDDCVRHAIAGIDPGHRPERSALLEAHEFLSGAGSTAAVWTVFLALTALNAARLEGLLAHFSVTARSMSTSADPASSFCKHHAFNATAAA
jgi:hypothetical protein